MVSVEEEPSGSMPSSVNKRAHYGELLYEQQRSSNYSFSFILIILLLGGILFMYIKTRSLNPFVWMSFIQKIIHQKQSAQTKSVDLGQKSLFRNEIIQDTQQKEDLKGWETDDTVSIDVDYLTIEDMINPIMLCNEHEKAVRHMMWYMRRLEEYPDDKVRLVLGEAGLFPHLEKLWLSINSPHVRSVYIRSLYLLVENYATRDTKVLSFLETMEKTVKVRLPPT